MSRLLLKNCIGEIYEDKIILNEKKIYPNAIASINMFKYISNVFNITLAVVGIIFLFIAYLKLTDSLIFYMSLILCTISLLIAAFYQYKKYFLIVTFSGEEPIKIYIRKKNKRHAKEFLKKIIEIKSKS